MNRNNPHVRDIFHDPRKDLVPNNLQEVCVYDYSPGSRKKKRDFDVLPNEFLGEDPKKLIEDGNGNSKLEDCNLGNNKNKNKKKNKSSMDENRIPSECKKNNANKNSNCGNYGMKTLTDKDIRHLERHLSMKKTIRKQISRNLAQAFVEDPNAVQSEILSNESAATSQQPEKSSNRSFTLTRAKVTKSEQNVLDMLRDTRDDPQSDFASPCNPSPGEEQQRFQRHDVVPSVKENISESKDNVVTGDRFSFWKMFSIWGKGKR
ncbi:uncharacterized protein DDB_G0288805-like [Limulus polyphemus]|uniref:Uncharacterized protein DDB_G0288805-like n=1 Tax=Limulus polyphemus TaxID=6850 RepID=A0ABM1BW32_LIMPO|nr:uncharacterized protein DDB_G0288805-like [Limulus polyphemus]